MVLTVRTHTKVVLDQLAKEHGRALSTPNPQSFRNAFLGAGGSQISQIGRALAGNLGHATLGPGRERPWLPIFPDDREMVWFTQPLG